MDFPNSWKFLKVREAESRIMLRSQRRCRLPPHPPPTTTPPRVLHSTQACPSHVPDGKARGCRMKTSHGCSHSHAIFHPKQPPHSGMLPPSQTRGLFCCFPQKCSCYGLGTALHSLTSPHILSSCSHPWHGCTGGKMDSPGLQPGELTSRRETPALDTH